VTNDINGALVKHFIHHHIPHPDPDIPPHTDLPELKKDEKKNTTPVQVSLVQSETSQDNWEQTTKAVFGIDILILVFWFLVFGLIPAVVACFYECCKKKVLP
jgi:hypothetical protein